jgi:signal transduction histidine kinase
VLGSQGRAIPGSLAELIAVLPRKAAQLLVTTNAQGTDAMARRRTLVVYIVAWLVALGGTLRYLEYILEQPSRWAILGLLVAFFVLLAIAPWLSRRSPQYMHLYLAVQTCILVALTGVTTIEDFAAIPFMSLILLAMIIFPPKIGFRWIGVFIVILVVCMIVYGLVYHGINTEWILLNALLYITIYLAAGAILAVVRQLETARNEAEVARKESEELLAELQVAHQQLQAYTGQAEDLAVIAERNRLARNLHDSVSQTVFSMTLTAEAARILFDRDAARAAAELDKLQALARSALSEMRSLVFELRPTAVTEQGLIPALRHHIVELERQYGLVVALQVEGEPHLTDLEAQRLFRVIQEALNNVVKHARTDRASVALQFETMRVLVRIEDEGQGFAPEGAEAEGQGIGLSTMRERVEMLGGTLTIDSSPGAGTRVTVELNAGNGEGSHDKD